MNLLHIASRVAARKKPKSKKREKEIFHQEPEFACRVEIDLVADFEGEGSKSVLLKKLKTEISAALNSAMEISARDLRLDLKKVTVRPVSLDCAVTEGTSEDEEF
jgi:hypothetical protein